MSTETALCTPFQERTGTARGALCPWQNVQQRAASLEDPEERIIMLEGALQQCRLREHQAQMTLLSIYASPGWRLFHAYNRLCDRIGRRIIPRGSRRRQVVRFCYHLARRCARTLMRVVRRLPPVLVEESYARWIAKTEPGPAELERQRALQFARRPLISILVPTYNTPLPFLREMVESVRVQTYPHWELCIADGNSQAPGVRDALREYAEADPRIKVRLGERNLGIAGNTNAAAEMATGDYVALLDHDDTLAPFALFEVVRAINESPDVDLLYSDEDKLDPAGTRTTPHFKPAYSPDLLRSSNYVCHLAVIRRGLWDDLGGMRAGFDGAQDHDLMLRVFEQTDRIGHIPKVLYHWRMHPASTSDNMAEKQYALESGRRAVQEHLERTGVEGEVSLGAAPGTYKVVRALPHRPLISIIIPNRDQPASLARCMESIRRSSYDNLEVLVVENHSVQPETFEYYRQIEQDPRVRVLEWDQHFNYAAVNNYAAGQARGEVLLLLNNDVEAINPDWMERMLEHALRPEVGAVGAKLYFGNDTIQHAGVILGIGGVAGHWHKGMPRRSDGYYNRLAAIQNVSAVTGACLMMRRDVFDEVGGMDTTFELAFNDVDMCVRIRQRGYAIIWTPYAELYHHESTTRGPEDTPQKVARFHREVASFLLKWGETLHFGDPYYSPNLSLDSEGCEIRV